MSERRFARCDACAFANPATVPAEFFATNEVTAVSVRIMRAIVSTDMAVRRRTTSVTTASPSLVIAGVSPTRAIVFEALLEPHAARTAPDAAMMPVERNMLRRLMLCDVEFVMASIP
jgi:hypothetical protein